MTYDVTLITVRPGTTPKALERLGHWLATPASSGELLACWYSELGALNVILLMRAYAEEALIAADRDRVAQSGDCFGIAEFIVSASMETYRPFPFMAAIRPGRHGQYYELRTYQLKPNALATTIELWRKAVPGRAQLSPLLAAMYSVSGPIARFMHIWPWQSLDARQRIRAEAVETGVWPPPGGPELLIAQQADIFLPAAFSPLQ
jgi:hypothetical protein